MSPWMDRFAQSPLARGALVFALAFAVYAPVLTQGTRFLWDDDSELWGTRGHLVQDDDGIAQAWWPVIVPEDDWLDLTQWRPEPGLGFWPLTPTVLWLEWRAFGADARWASGATQAERIANVEEIANLFHVPGIVLHATCALLLVAVLRRLRAPGAYLAGLLFVVHPMNVSSVAWVSELKNTLSLGLGLLAVLLYLRFEAAPSGARYAGALLAFFLSLSAKTAGVGLPLVLLALAFLQRGRVTRQDLVRSAPFFLLALAMGLTTIWFTRESGGLGEYAVVPQGFLHSLALSGRLPFFYLFETFFPVDLMMIHPRIVVDPRSPLAYLPGLVLAGALALLFWQRGRIGRGPVVSLFIMLVLLFPVLGFFHMTFMMHAEVAEHFHYMAICPLLALVAAGIAKLGVRRPELRRGVTAASIGLLALLAVMSFARARVFQSHERLWADNVARNPRAWMAQYNLGSSLLSRAEESETSAQESRAIAARAAPHLEAALELQPLHQLSAYRLGTARLLLGEDAEAEAAFRRAIELSEQKGQRGHTAQVGSLLALARMHAAAQRWSSAVSEYEALIAVAPELQVARFELGQVLANGGDEAAALAVLLELLDRNPSHFRAHVAVATLLATSANPTLRDGEAAMRHARLARALQGEGPRARLRALHAVALAEAELGASGAAPPEPAFRRAADAMVEAHELARRLGDPVEIRLARQRLALFSKGRAVRRER